MHHALHCWYNGLPKLCTESTIFSGSTKFETETKRRRRGHSSCPQQ